METKLKVVSTEIPERFLPVPLTTDRGNNIVKDIHINVFRSRKDNKVRSLPTTWENIVGLFTFGHEEVENKEDVNLFNTAHYKEVDQVPDNSEDFHVDSLTGIFQHLYCADAD